MRLLLLFIFINIIVIVVGPVDNLNKRNSLRKQDIYPVDKIRTTVL